MIQQLDKRRHVSPKKLAPPRKPVDSEGRKRDLFIKMNRDSCFTQCYRAWANPKKEEWWKELWHRTITYPLPGRTYQDDVPFTAWWDMWSFRGGIVFGRLRTKNWSLQRHVVFWHMTRWFGDIETSLVMTLAKLLLLTEVSATKWQVCNKYEALISLRFITVLKVHGTVPTYQLFMDSLLTYHLVSASSIFTLRYLIWSYCNRKSFVNRTLFILQVLLFCVRDPHASKVHEMNQQTSLRQLSQFTTPF